MGLALLALLALLVACGPRPEARVKGKGYSFPIPQGWERVDTKELKADSGIKQSKPATPDLRAVFLVQPLDAAAAAFEPTDTAVCKQTAEAMAAARKGSASGVGLANGPTGKTCQFAVTAGTRETRFTFVKGPKEPWLIGCDRDIKDQAVLAACDQALAGLRFE